jgi:hypothetical protein
MSLTSAPVLQLPRFSSARANTSASFSSFPPVSRISRFRMQPMRRAGWQGTGLARPARNLQVLAATLGISEDRVGRCFFRQIDG